MLAGCEEGLRSGRTGQIRLLQQFLNQPQSSEQQLAALTLTELDDRVTDLRTRLDNRENP